MVIAFGSLFIVSPTFVVCKSPANGAIVFHCKFEKGLYEKILFIFPKKIKPFELILQLVYSVFPNTKVPPKL
jgi:hypothetical protein